MTISLNAMIRQISGLADTKDVSEWESEFIKNVVDRSDNGTSLRALSDKQLEIVEKLWKKHFAS